MQQPNTRLGQQGEELACSWLTSHHFHILERNLAFGRWEIDVLAFDPSTDELVVIEVKTRHSTRYGHPSQAVDFRKIRALYQVIKSYCYQHHLAKDLRFDIISVLPTRIEHFKNVSW